MNSIPMVHKLNRTWRTKVCWEKPSAWSRLMKRHLEALNYRQIDPRHQALTIEFFLIESWNKIPWCVQQFLATSSSQLQIKIVVQVLWRQIWIEKPYRTLCWGPILVSLKEGHLAIWMLDHKREYRLASKRCLWILTWDKLKMRLQAISHSFKSPRKSKITRNTSKMALVPLLNKKIRKF